MRGGEEGKGGGGVERGGAGLGGVGWGWGLGVGGRWGGVTCMGKYDGAHLKQHEHREVQVLEIPVRVCLPEHLSTRHTRSYMLAWLTCTAAAEKKNSGWFAFGAQLPLVRGEPNDRGTSVPTGIFSYDLLQ